ncbi:UNVERIFIED_CONTAM: nitronate monooxygenase [Halobacillus marinus]|uniref:NAD(P)H-dependent flavin oxidoreductase n=1 Tax=Halobacillus sp. KGW1 TaxID=1793726 RepID=UPI0007847ED5|nr:nitronate monooxygenase [Halobacillus sp. KGW1]
MKEILGLTYPIIQAGMAGGVTTPELVAAVSNTGALGSLGAGYMTGDALKTSVQRIKQLTNRPFAVNLFVPEYPTYSKAEMEEAERWLEPYRRELGVEVSPIPEADMDHFDRQVCILIEENVPIVSFTFGIPHRKTMERLKQEGIQLIGTATNVEEAVLNERSGMDMVVAQGSEAGGHRGTFLGSERGGMIGTISLVPQIFDQVTIPVIAAGGIMDSRGVRAAMALGASGVQMGTAFVTCKESGAHPRHKEAILGARETETAVTASFSGKPARGIENAFIRRMEGKPHLPYPLQNSLTKPIRSAAAQNGDTRYMSLWSGQSPRLSDNRSAAEVIKSAME